MSSQSATIDATRTDVIAPIDNCTVVVEHEPSAVIAVAERNQIAAQPLVRLGGQNRADVAV